MDGLVTAAHEVFRYRENRESQHQEKLLPLFLFFAIIQKQERKNAKLEHDVGFRPQRQRNDGGERRLRSEILRTQRRKREREVVLVPAEQFG